MTLALEIPVDSGLTPRRQIEGPIARLGPAYCLVHKEVLLKADTEATIRDAFDPVVYSYPDEDQFGRQYTSRQESWPRHLYSISIRYERCPGCPLSRGECLER